jgi:hypothetical protein
MWTLFRFTRCAYRGGQSCFAIHSSTTGAMRVRHLPP